MRAFWGRSTLHKPYSNSILRSRKPHKVLGYAYPLIMPFALFEVEKHFGRKEGYGLLCGNCAAICRELGQSAKAEEYEVQRKKYCPEA